MTAVRSRERRQEGVRIIERELLDRVLAPYKPHCRYLQTAGVVGLGAGAGEIVAAEGEFAIPASCYIASTGHFNAVEFNICYNQLAYYLLAVSAKYGLFEAMNGWSTEEFERRQLSDFLIVQFSSTFRSPMRADRFNGRVAVESVRPHSSGVFLKTKCSFEDGLGGRSEGTALLAIVGLLAA